MHALYLLVNFDEIKFVQQLLHLLHILPFDSLVKSCTFETSRLLICSVTIKQG